MHNGSCLQSSYTRIERHSWYTRVATPLVSVEARLNIVYLIGKACLAQTACFCGHHLAESVTRLHARLSGGTKVRISKTYYRESHSISEPYVLGLRTKPASFAAPAGTVQAGGNSQRETHKSLESLTSTSACAGICLSYTRHRNESL